MQNTYENQFPPLPAPVRSTSNSEIVSNPVANLSLVAHPSVNSIMSSYSSNQSSSVPAVTSELLIPSYQYQDHQLYAPSQLQWGAVQSNPTVNSSSVLHSQFLAVHPFPNVAANAVSETGSFLDRNYGYYSSGQGHGLFERSFPSSPSVAQLGISNNPLNCHHANHESIKPDVERLAVGNGRPTGPPKCDKKFEGSSIMQLLQACGNSNAKSHVEPGHLWKKNHEGIGMVGTITHSKYAPVFSLSSKPVVQSCGTQTDGHFVQSLDHSFRAFGATQSDFPEGTYEVWNFPIAHSNCSIARAKFLGNDTPTSTSVRPVDVDGSFRQPFVKNILVNGSQFPPPSNGLPTNGVASHDLSDNQGKCRYALQNLQVILAQMQLNNASSTMTKPISIDGTTTSVPTVPFSSSSYGTGKGSASSSTTNDVQWNNSEPKNATIGRYSPPVSISVPCSPPSDSKDPLYSRKIFVGGLTRNMVKEDLMNGFRNFGVTDVTWCSRDGGDTLINGCAYVILRSQNQVKALLKTCTPCRCSNEFGNGQTTWHYRLPYRSTKTVVEVIVWDVFQNQFICENLSTSPDNGYSVFVGNVHGRLTAKDLATFFYDQGMRDVKLVKIGTDRWEYPVGHARVIFASYTSFIDVIKIKRLILSPPGFHRRSLQLEPFIDGNKCHSCSKDSAVAFCKDEQCYKYFCQQCFLDTHIQGKFKCHTDITLRRDKFKLL